MSSKRRFLWYFGLGCLKPMFQ